MSAVILLQGCDLYVMDACAMVTIDDCKDCRIFIGPTESRCAYDKPAPIVLQFTPGHQDCCKLATSCTTSKDCAK
jgi:hypothetical protein